MVDDMDVDVIHWGTGWKKTHRATETTDILH